MTVNRCSCAGCAAHDARQVAMVEAACADEPVVERDRPSGFMDAINEARRSLLEQGDVIDSEAWRWIAEDAAEDDRDRIIERLELRVEILERQLDELRRQVG